MSLGVSLYIMLIVVLNIAGCWWLLEWTKNLKTDETNGKVNHSYDNIEEYNNPLPRWWLYLFYITIVFSIVYLVLYPGFGHFKGLLGWTQVNQYEAEVSKVNETIAPLYAELNARPIAELARDPKALAIGQRLFGNNCALCHGSDAKGSPSFPNLTDNDWLYGGTPELIKQSILHGRMGAMPAFKESLDEPTRIGLRHYTLALSGRDHDRQLAAAAANTFGTLCAACHGQDGKGNQLLGAPNLTDKIWLYGGSHAAIADTINHGRNGQMPSFESALGEERVHILAAYIYSLSLESKH